MYLDLSSRLLMGGRLVETMADTYEQHIDASIHRFSLLLVKITSR